jgi:hypothetical protein
MAAKIKAVKREPPLAMTAAAVAAPRGKVPFYG